jgi:hypothetical protein
VLSALQQNKLVRINSQRETRLYPSIASARDFKDGGALARDFKNGGADEPPKLVITITATCSKKWNFYTLSLSYISLSLFTNSTRRGIEPETQLKYRTHST